jgi:ubiquinone/menaquinone biosynthesis C-methylase UbiE
MASPNNSATYYDGIAAGYNELHGDEQRNKYRLIAEQLNLPLDARILDVGAGTGIGNEFFPLMIGCDPSPELLKQHPNKQSVVCSAELLPFGDESFDAVLCVSALHHTDYLKAIEEMKRVSKGIVVLTVLKKSPKFNELCKAIKSSLKVIAQIDEPKDLLFVARKA